MGIFGGLFGDASTPGVMGTGQFVAQPNTINQQAFQNPVGDQSQNWNSGMGNMLGATTGQAAQAGNTQLGAAQTYGGAQIGPTATYGGAQLNGGQYNQVYGQEQGLASQLGAQAQGLGPSVAQVTAQQQAGQNLQNQMAMLGSQRGSSNPALAQQAALNAGSSANQQAAQQAVLGRTQEELGAQQNLSALQGQMGSQATNFANANAGLAQQAGLANQGALNANNLAQAGMYQQAGLSNQQDINQFGLQQGQMNQATTAANLQQQLAQGQLNAQQYNEYMNNLQGMNLAQYQGQMAGQQLATNQNLGINQINSGAYNNAASNRSSTTGGMLGALGSIMGM